MSYSYDVFISYRRSPAQARDWTQHVLYPTLRTWLENELNLKPEQIFIDTEHLSDNGLPWPPKLREAILGSKVLVAVLSPQYFESDWCRTELYSMLERQQRTGGRCVYLLQVFDGDCYPPEIHVRSPADLSKYATLNRRYLPQRGWDERCKKMANELKGLLAQAPPYDPDAPIVAHGDATRLFPKPEYPE
ncbi:MAG TPA: toll/interleukin-1 receptor domain-containing protein [Myxococcota bacterium]|nr:toll/interleukin-1 receptor domain-containing protein [Myxococcota bacterium]